jgi:hypothetical protein
MLMRIVAMVVLVSLAGAAHAADPAKILRVAMFDIDTLDPQQYSEDPSFQVIQALFEPAYEWDYLSKTLKLTPLTAAGPPEVTEDGKVWTIRFKRGILFTDDPAFKCALLQKWIKRQAKSAFGLRVPAAGRTIMPRGSVAGSADHKRGHNLPPLVDRSLLRMSRIGQERRVGRGTLVSPMGPRCPPSIMAPAPLQAAASSGSPSWLRTRSAHAACGPFQGYDCPNADRTGMMP